MLNLLKVLWHEPRLPHAPGPRWQDWLMVGVVVMLTAVELVFRQDILWRPLAAGLTLVFALSLPWRRVHPVAMIIPVFGANASVQIYALLKGVDWDALYTTVLILVLPYALLRWGSGREAFTGLGFIGVTFAATISIENPPLGEIAGASLFILFPSALGASVRYQNTAQQRANEQIRLREREQLARELHDTVGHYVSAIAVQAQAGRAQAPTRPGASLEALEVIEDAASRALGEMRSILRALRGDDAVAYAPAASITDIERLAQSDAYPFAVEVDLTGEAGSLDSTVTSTLYRLIQESITNAVRHGKGVEQLSIGIVADAQQVRLEISDDGDPVSQNATPGLGLQGMAERVGLLGGTIRTGPGEARGWRVEATLPLRGGVA